eukprot:6490257-Amphidinium_carterae.1
MGGEKPIVQTPQTKTSKKIETGTKAKKSSLAPRTVDKRDSLSEAVRKALHDNFKGWSREAVTTIKVNDMSITERLMADKKRWIATGSPTMGKFYYRELKAEYGGNPDKASGAFTIDQKEAVSPKLHAAMVKAKQHPADRTALLAFVECVTSLTHREFVGILRVMEDLQPSASVIQRQLALEMARMIARLDLKSRWPAEVSAMGPKIEEILVEAHIKAVKVGTTPRAFLTQHSSTWPLVLPELQVHELVNLEESSAWSSAKTALYSVVGSGELGRRLFGEFIMDLVADDVHQIVRKASDSVFTAAKIDHATIGKLRQETQDKVLSLPDADLIPSPWEVKIVYRGREVGVQVRSIDEYIDLALKGAIRSIAVCQGLVPELPGESMVASDKTEVQTAAKVDAGLVADCYSSREWAAKTMRLCGQNDGKS